MDISAIKSRIVKYLLISIGMLVIIVAAYLYVVFSWSFSKGERIGYVQKFSQKGWICKTWEGELQMLPVPGAIPEKFYFTVRDNSIVNKLNSSLGKKVSITYEQHKGIPTKCFGETEYYIVETKVID